MHIYASTFETRVITLILFFIFAVRRGNSSNNSSRRRRSSSNTLPGTGPLSPPDHRDLDLGRESSDPEWRTEKGIAMDEKHRDATSYTISATYRGRLRATRTYADKEMPAGEDLCGITAAGYPLKRILFSSRWCSRSGVDSIPFLVDFPSTHC